MPPEINQAIDQDQDQVQNYQEPDPVETNEVEPQGEAEPVAEARTSDQEDSDLLDMMEKRLGEMRDDDVVAPATEPDEGKDEPQAKDEDESAEKAEDPDAVAQAKQDKEDDELIASITNERTANRIQHFREENKKIKGELEALSEQHTNLEKASLTLLEYIEDSQTTSDQLSAELALNKAVNTGDFTDVRPAYERMKQQMAKVALGLGEPLQDMPLPDHLQDAVNNLDITPELAQRQAAMLAQQQLREHYQQSRFNSQQQMEQEQAARTQAVEQIRQWERQMSTTDADFKGKQQQMLESADQIMRSTPPDQWLNSLQNQYHIISQTQQRLSSQRTREPSPLRPGTTSGSTNAAPVPKNFDDNFNQTLKLLQSKRG